MPANLNGTSTIEVSGVELVGVVGAISIFSKYFFFKFRTNGGPVHGRFSDLPNWIRWLFLEILPRFLRLKPYEAYDTDDDESSISDTQGQGPSHLQRRLSMMPRTAVERRPSPYFLNVT